MVIGLVLAAARVGGGPLQNEEELWLLLDNFLAASLSFASATIWIHVFVFGSGDDIATELLCGALALWNMTDGLLRVDYH